MTRLLAMVSVLSAGIGCAGPIEKPTLQPPALPMSQEEAETGSGFPDTAGAWTSVSLKGPGSAAWQRVDLVLHDDGRCLLVGEGKEEVQAFAGQATWSDAALTVVRQDGRTLRFAWRREGPLLILTEGASEIRLTPLRP
jgi:hypothetical protein